MDKIGYVLVSFLFINLSAAQRREPTSVFRSLSSIKDCLSNRYPVVCFKERALDLLNETINSDKPMSFYNMIEISKNPKYLINNTEGEGLPEDVVQRSLKLNEVLKDKVEELFKSRTIKFDMEPMVEEGEDEDEETETLNESRAMKKVNGKYIYDIRDGGDGGGYSGGSGKKCRGKGGGGGGGGGKGGKGGGGMMMMGMIGMGCMMAQMMMGKVAFMAGTALIVAKIALFLSAIIGLKKLSSGGGGGETSAHVIYASDHGHGGGGGGWHRSIDGSTAQTMAYRAYADNNNERWSKESGEIMCGGAFKAINGSQIAGYGERKAS